MKKIIYIIIGILVLVGALLIINPFEKGIGELQHYQVLNSYEGSPDDVLDVNDLYGEITCYPAVAEIMWSSSDGWIPAEQFFTFENKRAVPVNNVRIASRFEGELRYVRLWELVTREKQTITGYEETINVIGNYPNGSEQIEVINTPIYTTTYNDEWVRRTPESTTINNKKIYYTIVNFGANEKKTFKVKYLPAINDLSGKWDVIAFTGAPQSPDYSIELDPYFTYGYGEGWEGWFNGTTGSTRQSGDAVLMLNYSSGNAVPYRYIGNFESNGQGDGTNTKWNMSVEMPYNYSKAQVNGTGVVVFLHMNESSGDLVDESYGVLWVDVASPVYNTSDGCVIDRCVGIDAGATDYFQRSTLNFDNDDIENADFSVEFWFKRTGGLGTEIIYNYGDDTNRVIISTDSNGLHCTIIGGGSAIVDGVGGGNMVNDGEWHYGYCQFGSGGNKIYVDGNIYVDGSDTDVLPIVTPDKNYLFRFNANNYFLGFLDEFVIRTSYLTSTQINNNFLQGAGKVIVQTSYSSDNSTWLGFKNYTETQSKVLINASMPYAKFWVFFRTVNISISPNVNSLNLSADSQASPPINNLDLYQLRLESTATAKTNYTNEDLFVSFIPVVNNTSTPLTATVSYVPSFTQGKGFGDGLVLHYHFDANESNITDYSGYGNNGTVIGATFNSTGKIGGAFEFDGVNDYINITDLNINHTSFWVYAKENVNDRIMVNKLNQDYGIRTQSSGIIEITTSETYVSNKVLELNQWQYLSFDYNGSGYLFYYNGVYDTFLGSESLILGRIGRTSLGLNGSIDEVMIFNRSLSASEISELYKKQSNNFLNLPATNGTYFENKLTYPNTTKYESWYSTVLLSYAEGSIYNQTNNLIVLNSPPTVPNINYPDNNTLTSNYSISLSCSGSTDIDGDTNYEFYMDTFNPPVTLRYNSTSTSTTNTSIDSVVYWWRCRANDNQSVSNFNDTRMFTVDRRLIIYNHTYFNDVINLLEGTYIYFEYNLSINKLMINNLDSAILTYNSTNYTSSVSQVNSTYFKVSNTITSPKVSGSETKDFYWKFTLSLLNGTINYNLSTTSQQTISQIYLFNCSDTTVNASSVLIFNYTFWDEDIEVNLSSDFDASYTMWSDDNSVNRTLTFDLINQTKVGICLTPKDKNVNTEGQIEYTQSYGVLYDKRFYFYQAYPTTNTTHNTKLYLLPFSKGTKTTFKVQDSNEYPVVDALIYVDKYFAGRGEYETVAMGKTDSSGKSSMYLYQLTTTYRIRVVKNNEVLATVTYPVIGEDKIITIGATIDIEDVIDIESGVYNLSNNPTTKVVTATFNYATSVRGYLDVHLKRALNDTWICGTSTEGTSGILTCDYSAYDEGIVYASFSAEKKGAKNEYEKKILLSSFEVDLRDKTLKENLGTDGLWLAALIIIVLTFIGIVKAELALIFGIFGLIISVLIGFVDIAWGSLIAIIIAGIFLLIRGNR